MLGAYIALRKTVGIIPALITVYLMYVYRNDVNGSIQGIINGRT
jgi:hypothetical protein